MRRSLTAALLLGMTMVDASAWAGGESPIRSDEEVLFYPTYGVLDAGGASWRLNIHGSIFEPEAGSWKRAFVLRMLREGLPANLGPEEKATLDRRLQLFLVDDERGKEISIRLAGRIFPVGTSGPNGHFAGTVRVSVADLRETSANAADAERWISFQAVAPRGDGRVFAGRVRLTKPTGLSVVSDIDDTIKISQVRDRKALLANTFLRPFRPVPGMADLYRRLAEGGAAFHYVSASPWQLYPALRDFRRQEGFPEGTFHLKTVRLTDSTVLDLFGSQEGFKHAVIGRLMADFPERRFALVGDTGEQDPEIFGRIARQRGGQVVAVFLRNVTDETADGDRMKAALEGVPESKWALFREPAELHDRVEGLTK